MTGLFRKIITAILISLTIFACKTKNIAVSEASRIRHMSTLKILKEVTANDIEYETLSVKKMGLSLKTKERSLSVRGSYKIKRDSTIIINAQKITIPVGKIQITPGRYHVVSHIDNTVYSGIIDSLVNKIGMELDFNLLQSILSNHIFSLKNNLSAHDLRYYNSSVEDGMYKLASIKERKFKKITKKEAKKQAVPDNTEGNRLVKHEILIDPKLFVIRKMTLEESGSDNYTTLEFNKYHTYDNYVFPEIIKLTISGGKSVELTIQLSKVQINEEKNFNFKIPSKYERKEF